MAEAVRNLNAFCVFCEAEMNARAPVFHDEKPQRASKIINGKAVCWKPTHQLKAQENAEDDADTTEPQPAFDSSGHIDWSNPAYREVVEKAKAESEVLDREGGDLMARLPFSPCNFCPKSIKYARSINDRPMPLDPEPVATGNILLTTWRSAGFDTVEDPDQVIALVITAKSEETLGDLLVDARRYTTHFATCPNWPKHRRKMS